MGSIVRGFLANFDTSLGSTTLSIGTTANPTKYVAARPLATTDMPSSLGPKASAFVAAPITSNEEVFVTIGGAAIPAAVIGAFDMTYKIST